MHSIIFVPRAYAISVMFLYHHSKITDVHTIEFRIFLGTVKYNIGQDTAVHRLARISEHDKDGGH